ncbi:lecithin retinol acyltransferase family protein [Leptolyngbya sp. CCY15150]|uniref:lecithin retinol acyltransferase family protein n=1 Tax=Leptolyngbya sp. CCY15150 TaxID=2767772 RepID=UPI00194FBE85|nr:lecithin retinol acyltransferase family protein [Leptolyngbya sp. CCY15150]
MARGDQIYVMRPLGKMQGVYEHHGIDYGDGSVIHYRKPEQEPAIISHTSMSSFSQGHRIYIKRYQTSFIADDVIRRAESRLGEQQYDLLTNNCEHFATWCKTGQQDSAQLRQFGLGFAGFSPKESHQLVEEATVSTPEQAIPLVQQALNNVAIARAPLQARYDRAIADMQTWHRVAQLALRQGKETVARAALERKVASKKQLPDLQAQLRTLDDLQRDLQKKLQQVQTRSF